MAMKGDFVENRCVRQSFAAVACEEVGKTPVVGGRAEMVQKGRRAAVGRSTFPSHNCCTAPQK